MTSRAGSTGAAGDVDAATAGDGGDAGALGPDRPGGPHPPVPLAPLLDPVRRAELEEERDFALGSLRDLAAEHDVGDIDDRDYAVLTERYLARAATALRALDGTAAAGVEAADAAAATAARPEGSPGRAGPWRRRLLIVVGVALVAGGAAWAVVASSATRLPGQEITGQALGAQVEAQTLQQAEQAADRGDGVNALKGFQKVLDSDPNQPEALTGEGWLLAQTQQPSLLRQGLTRLLAAEQAAPTYAPAHVYRGIALLSEGNYAAAIPELQWYLSHSPEPQLVPQVRQALQQAQAKAAAAKAAAAKG
jgi:tetratricopeptide (TPR) repeat protein